MEKEKKEKIKKGNVKKYVLVVLIFVLIILLICLGYNIYINNRDKNNMKELQKEIETQEKENTINIVEEEKNQEIIKKVSELQLENDDIKGWIKIDDTKINYPLLQGDDNEYYLKRNYKKENSNYGSIFIDKDCDLNDINSNVIIYGHNMKDKEMFQNLLNYEDKGFYEQHKNIEIITNEKTMTYEIVTVFKSRVFYQNETNVFRYYYCKDLSNQEKYNDYINNCKKIQLYDTGINAEYGEQLITLIVCEYSQNNGRMVVVAKKIK